MKGLKFLLLGIFFVLFGIFWLLFTDAFSGFEAMELVAFFSPLLGFGLALFGFFSKNKG